MSEGADPYRARQGPASCDEVGFRRGGQLDRDVGAQFRRAYEVAGGEALVGCPRNDDPSGYVGLWGPGLRQDLRGGTEEEARIMAVGEDGHYGTAVVMSGRWFRDYTYGSGYGPNSGPVLGYPVTDPFPIGRGLVVRLSGGEAGAGLMASGPDGTMFWVRGHAARHWLEFGGPDGPLGRPADWPEQRGAGSYAQRFEQGLAVVQPDGAVSVDLTAEVASAPALTSQLRQLLEELNRELQGSVDDPFTARGWLEVAAGLKEAEREIERGRYPNAVTDLGTVLQLALGRAGYSGNQLGDQLKAARLGGLFAGLDVRLGTAAENISYWISGLRNTRSDAHPSPPPTRPEALLAFRLTESIAGWLADREGPL